MEVQPEVLVETKPRRPFAPWKPEPEPIDWRAWMETFRTEHDRPPRILHIGNVANNGYNNAKVLVEAGFDCDAICYDYYHIMGCPEWEDADFGGMVADHFFPDWNEVRLNGFKRPRWFVQGPRLWAIGYLIAKADGRTRSAKVLWATLAVQRWFVAHRPRWWYRSCKSTVRRIQSYRQANRVWIGRVGTGVRTRSGAAIGRVRQSPRSVAQRLTLSTSRVVRRLRPFARRVRNLGRAPRGLSRRARVLISRVRARTRTWIWPLAPLTDGLLYLLLLPAVIVACALLTVCVPFAVLYQGCRPIARSLRGRRERRAARAASRDRPRSFATRKRHLPFWTRVRNRVYYELTGVRLTWIDNDRFEADFRDRAEELIADFARRFPDRPDQLSFLDIVPYRSILPLWEELFKRYDAIEAYATDPIIPMLCGRDCVAYEHGTIREIPFDDSPTARLTALAYARARAVVITNPDCRAAADRMGVTSFVPIPHLIDRKYYNPHIADAGALPPGIRPPYIFSPARHDWDIKGTHILINAFARIADEFPDLQLVTPAWGGDLDRSHELMTRLGVGHRVAMIDPVNIHNLIRVTRGARALVDQFRFGVFGGIGPTALAVGTPLITHLDHSKSDWWMEPPPYFEAWDEDSCVDALRRALTADAGALRASLRAWMRRNYWHGQVVDRHAQLFATLITESQRNQEST